MKRLIFVIALCVHTASATPTINEFLAENDRLHLDVDNNSPDWIEIYNPGPGTLDLGGYTLSDDTNLTRWAFSPGTVVAANGYLVVFASGKDRSDPAQELHTNFSLQNGGESVYLTEPDGATIISFFEDYPEQYRNISYGQLPSGGTGYFETPTPGAANGTGVIDFVNDTQFSHKRGFYSASFTLSITSSTPSVSIRYTTDGSEPDATTGTLYTGPIAINQTTIIRALAYRTGWKPTNVDAQSYIFTADVLSQAGMNTQILNDPRYSGAMEGALRALPVVSLQYLESDMFGINGIYDNPNDTGDASERNVHIEYFDPDDPEETFHIAGGMRIHGGNGRRHAKKSIRLYFRAEYGLNRLDYDFYPDSPVKSFKRLLLRAGGHDAWTFTRTWAEASFMRNEFLHALQLAMDQPSPRGKLVHVYLNGAYWGFYAIQELPHADYHADHHGGEKLDWDVIKHGADAEDGDIASWNTLMSRTASPITTEVAYDQVLEYMDVDNFIDSMIHRIWSSDEDWLGPQYRNGVNITHFHDKNWYAARKSRNGIQPFRFYCWDAEMSMGVSITGNNRSYEHDLSRVDDSGSPGQIYDALRGYAPFQTRFGDRLQQHFFNDGPYTPANLAVIWDSLSNLVQTAIIPESARWGDGGDSINRTIPYTKDDQWKPAVDWVSDTYIPLRSGEVLSHFRTQGLYPAVDAPAFNPIGGLFNDPGTTLVITPPAGLGTVYYTRDGNDPMISDATSSGLELVEETSAVQALVPSTTNGGAVLGTSWHQVADPLNLAIWKTGINGVGYETSTGYEAYINLDVLEMQNATGSCFIRIPFTIPDAITLASISALTLNMRYDDGYTAYINGTQIATHNAPVSPTWSSLSTTHHNDSEAIFYEPETVSAHINQLVVGDNMLAIQAFNRDLTSSDLLIMAKLSAQTSSGSDIHPSAAPYTAPLDVTSSETIKARFRSNTGVWSALVEGEYIVGVPADSNRVTVTEIMYHPDDAFTAAELAASTAASDFEFIEILNLHTQTVDLSDCSFSQGISFNFPDGYFLNPSQRALIVHNQAAFTARYGGHYVDQIVGEFEGDTKLSDAGERLTLVDGSLVTIFSVRYRDDSGWPDEADGTGNSLVQVDPYAGLNLDDLAQWRASYAADGRPGSDDIQDFSSWSSVQFNREQLDDPLVSGVLATPLGESLNNLVRYSFAYDLAPTHPLLNPFGTNGVLGVSYRSRSEIPDVAFVPYVSGDLETWNQNSPGNTHIIIHSEQDLGDGTRNTIILDTVPDAIRHLRMNLEYTPTP